MIEKNNNKEYFLKTQEFYNHLFEDDDHYGVREYWHGWAGNFHRYRVKLLRNIFINILKCQKNTQILDVGSSTSIFKEVFSPEECPQITALDISSILVQKANKIWPHIKSIVDDAQNPSLKGEWDIVFAGDIIEHLPHPREAVLKWDNLLKKKGYLVISTPNRCFSRKTKEHISLLTINETKKILHQLGFKKVEMIGIDIFIPFFDRFFNAIAKYIPKSSLICDIIFQSKMKSTLKLPWLARNVVYITKKS